MRVFSAGRSPKGGPRLYLVMLAVAVGVAAIASSALGAPVKKLFEATISPAYIAAGSTGTYTLTLTNDLTSQQGLGSANFVVPSGFSGVTVALTSAPAGKSWTANLVGGVVQFRSGAAKDALADGESAVASVTLAAPAATDPAACFARDDYSWSNEVKQSNDFSGTGNDFTLSGAKPSLTVAKLAFTTSPPQQVVSGATVTPPVVATAEDGCGKTLTNAQGTVSVAIGANPGGGTLGGTLSQSLTGGNATFSDLSVGPSPGGVGAGYTLVASDSAPAQFSQGTSSTFDVVGVLCTRTTGQCHVDDPPATTHLDAPTPPGNGALGLGFNNGYVPPQATTGKCPIANSHIGTIAVVDPSNVGGAYTVTLTYDKVVSGNGPAAAFAVCLFKPGDLDWRAPLQLCSATTPVNTPPCIVSRKRTTSGALQIILSLAAVDPGVITG